MKPGLILVPTPIQDHHPLEPVALEALAENSLKKEVILLVEEHKVARQRWLRWGLPREAIEKFVLFNEHTQDSSLPEILHKLRAEATAYLLSDCGLPAFCDPGQKLVDACHRTNIHVTATPFPNSISLALALSGLPHHRFTFSGFVPVKMPERKQWIQKELRDPHTQIWMETPYRLHKLLTELDELNLEREIFLAADLGGENELLLRGRASKVLKKFPSTEKREFVLLISPLVH